MSYNRGGSPFGTALTFAHALAKAQSKKAKAAKAPPPAPVKAESKPPVSGRRAMLLRVAEAAKRDEDRLPPDAFKHLRSENLPEPPRAATLAEQIHAAAAKARAPAEASSPKRGSLAEQIVAAGRKRRGEI